MSVCDDLQRRTAAHITVSWFGHFSSILIGKKVRMSLEMLRIHDPVARFEESITEDENGCWIWQGKIGTNGRAVFMR